MVMVLVAARIGWSRRGSPDGHGGQTERDGSSLGQADRLAAPPVGLRRPDLDGGGDCDDPAPWWDVFGGADGDDGGQVGYLFGVPAVDGRRLAGAGRGGAGRRGRCAGDAAEDCGGAEQRYGEARGEGGDDEADELGHGGAPFCAKRNGAGGPPSRGGPSTQVDVGWCGGPMRWWCRPAARRPWLHRQRQAVRPRAGWRRVRRWGRRRWRWRR